MFGFLSKLKCKLKSCCGSTLQCGEEAIRKDLEKKMEEEKKIKEQIENFNIKNYI